MRKNKIDPGLIRRYIAPYPALVSPRLGIDFVEVLSISFSIGEFGSPARSGLEIVSFFRKTFAGLDTYLLRKVFADFDKIEDGANDSIQILVEKEVTEESLQIFMNNLKVGSKILLSSHYFSAASNFKETKELLESSDVRLQWDPDHDPQGKPLERRAIQLGMKGDILRMYAQEWILKIEDITEFVIENYKYVCSNELNKLQCPFEKIYTVDNKDISQKIFS